MSLPEQPDLIMQTSDFVFDFSEEPQDSIMLEIDEIAEYEMMELEALVELADPSEMDQLPNRTSSPIYEDTDYDSLFMEFISTDSEQESRGMDVDQGPG